MTGRPTPNHVTTVFSGPALAAFSDAGDLPAGASSQEIATNAGAWLATHLGRSVPVLYARQEHTRITYVYGEERPLSPGAHLVGTCDALITAVRDVALLVRTADCLPVALAGGGAVAIVHAGWRGLAADILGATTARFAADFGTSTVELSAVVGVGVGPCHYPVGTEVVDGLCRHDSADARWQLGTSVDLAAFAKGRLTALGVLPERITVLPGCTSCLSEFHSHRRDGSGSGRQWSLVLLDRNHAALADG